MNNFKNLIIRSGSGLIFVAIIIASILLCPYFFALVFFILTGLGLYEFYKITHRAHAVEVHPIIGAAGGMLLFLCAFLHASITTTATIFALYALYALAMFIAELFRKKENPVANWAYFFLGQVYIALPFSLLNYILFIDGFQPWLLLAMFIVLWVNDSGAYLTGSLLGKHKMIERISPQKTWEGFIGGALLALIAGYVLSRYIPDISLWQWLLFAELVVVFGTLGDLCESLLKRTGNVKDAGNVIPGHGGILDRFDSMLLASPVALIFWRLILEIY